MARNRTTWRPGQSGNPGGRPRLPAEVRELIRVHTPAAIDALVKIMRDAKAAPGARVAAANAILDRAWGKPAQTIETSGGLGLVEILLSAGRDEEDEDEEDRDEQVTTH